MGLINNMFDEDKADIFEEQARRNTAGLSNLKRKKSKNFFSRGVKKGIEKSKSDFKIETGDKKRKKLRLKLDIEKNKIVFGR